MSYAEEIRRQAEDAPRAALPAITGALWRAYSDGRITDAEAEALSGLIEARTASAPRWGANPKSPGLISPDRGAPNMGISQVSGLQTDVGISDNSGAKEYAAWHTPQQRAGSPRRAVGSRPRTDASMERRRRWAASGRLPLGLAARFTLAEQAVLALVAAEVARRKDCRLAVGHLAAIAGVSETTVRNAIREATKLGLVTVEERRVTGFRNDTNIVRIVSAEWTAWLRLARKGPAWFSAYPPVRERGGCKSAKGTPTQVPRSGKTGSSDPKKGCRRAAGDLDRSGPSRIRAGGGTGRAMR